MAEQKPGFEIKGRFYPDPESFRMGDPVLVEEVTGLSWPEFTERLDDPIYRTDLVRLAGLVAVAVWQQHPQWRRDRVARYVEQLDLDNVKYIGGDLEEPEEELADGPPAETAGSEPSSETSPSESASTPDSPSDDTNQTSSGDPGSDAGPA